MDEEIFINLKNCLNPNNDIRKKAETFIENKKIFNLTELLNNLFLIFSDTKYNIDNNLKSLSSTLYKNIISENCLWINLSSTLKDKIRNDLINLIETSDDETKIKNACVILANILFQECDKNNIKNLKLILKKFQTIQNKDKLVISYLFMLKTFFDKFEEKKLLSVDIINDLQAIIIPIIKNFNDQGNILEEKKLELVLDIYVLILPFMRFSFVMNTDYIFKPIIDLMKKINKKNKIYMKNLLVINDTINYYHSYIINLIKIICTTLFDLLKEIVENNSSDADNNMNKNIILVDDNDLELSNNVLYYLDIISLMCDKELIDKTSLTTMIHNNSSETYIPILLKLIDMFPQFDIENESWNISKAVCYILSFIVSTSPLDSITFKLLNYFSENFNSISLDKKINSILILSCILESKKLRIINFSIQSDILKIVNKIDDKNKIYSYVVSWILGKISENIPSIFAKNELPKLIPQFINIINNKFDENKNSYSNEVRINICIVFGNLIKFYGDENTNKLNNEFNMYYKFFIDDFIEASFKEENIISNLSFYLLRIIMNAIQFSSKDFQQSLEGIFNNILQKFDKITLLIKDNKNKIQKIYLEKLYKLQDNLCLVLSQIFNKIILKINISLCIQLYNSIINSFLIRDSKAYESGMLCLLNLVILLFNENTLKNNKLDVEIFFKLISAILLNIEIGDTNLKKIAILCILNLLKINSFTLSKYIFEIYEILKTISQNSNNTNEELKKLISKSIDDIEKSDIYKAKKPFN